MKKLITWLILAALLCGCTAFAETEETAPGYDVIYSSSNPVPEIAEKVRPAVPVVEVYTESWDATTREASVDKSAQGSGCYILADEEEGGYVLTNYHVVQDGDLFKILWLGGEECDATLVGYDDGTDIAVLKFTDAVPEGVEPIPMGDSDELRIGELAICIGNPGSGEETFFGTVTTGIISGIERDSVNAGNFTRSVPVIQTDAAINSGNSGGALLNAKGELVGIPTLKLAVVYEGLSFCIPINTIKEFIDQIISTGSVVRPRIGLTITSIDGPDEPMNKYPPIGAQVMAVDKNGPAGKAGVKEKDIIYSVNGERVESYSDVLKELDACEAGDTVQLVVYRYEYNEDGSIIPGYEKLEFEVKLEIID